MALTANLNLTATPATLVVTSDQRHIELTVRSAGETAEVTGVWPVIVEDDERTWEQVSDDGTTAVFELR